jgi:hypothetical protein
LDIHTLFTRGDNFTSLELVWKMRDPHKTRNENSTLQAAERGILIALCRR